MIYFFDNELNMVKVATSKNVISAVHEHELNGLILGTVETDLSYTEAFINDVDYFGYYYKDNYYLHKIKRVEHENENELVRITGRHIFFEDMLYGDYIRDVRPVNRDALYILNQTISANTRWQTVMTDTSKLHSETYYWVPPMEVLNDLTENVGIEYEPRILFDGQNINGFQLHVANRIGENTPIRVPFGSRVINLKYEVDYSEIVTGLYGHGKGEEVGDGYGRRINFSSVNFSRNGVVSPTGQLYMENPNITAQYGKDDGSPKFGRVIFEDIESASELANATYEAYLEQSRPKMLFEASVVDLGDVGMGDGVLIIRREYDVYFNARIHKLMVDLLDAENADVELGDYAHFKESKVQRKTRESNNQYRRETSSRIQQLKEQFNDRFDGEVNQMREDFEQALIDAHAEIQAAEQRMETLINTTRNDWTDTFDAEVAEIYRKADEDYNRIETEITGVIDSTRNEMESNFNADVQSAREYAEQQAQERADAVRTDLETVTSGHQVMLDDLETNVMNIDDFIGPRDRTLQSILDEQRLTLEEKIEVYSRNYPNLVVGTMFEDLSGWRPWHGRDGELELRTEESLNYVRIHPGESDTPSLESLNRFRLENGKKYVVAVDFRSEIVEDLDNTYFLSPNGNVVIPTSLTRGLTSDGEWHRYYFPMDWSDRRTDDFSILIGTHFLYGDTNEGIYDIRQIHVYEGDVVDIPWTPSPSDNQQIVNQLLYEVRELDDGMKSLASRTELDLLTDEFTTFTNEYIETSDRVERTIQEHDDWFESHGARMEMTADGFDQKVWLSDMEDINPNLIPLSPLLWENGSISAVDGTDINSSIAQTRLRTKSYFDVERHTIHSYSDSSLEGVGIRRIVFHEYFGDNYIRPISRDAGTSGYFTTSGDRIRIVLLNDEGADVTVEDIEDLRVRIKLEKGSHVTPFMQAFSNLEQSATKIALQVDDQESRISNFTVDLDGILGRVGDIEEDYIKQSSLEITPEYAQIGSMRIDGDTVGSLLRVSPSGIDAVAEAMRLSGDLYVDGDITALAVDAIEGNFARLWADEFSAITIDVEDISGITAEFERMYTLNANIERLVSQHVFSDGVTALVGDFVDINAGNIVTSGLSANIILSSHINSSNALIEKLFSNSARIDTLISKTHFVNEIKATSIDAVYADLRSVNSEIMDTNILKADWIQGGNALLDKVFANTAMFERMMAKSGFVSTMSAITLDLHELTIWRPDGVAFVQNGMERFGHPVPLTEYIEDGVEYNGRVYSTAAKGSKIFKIAYGDHSGRYYNLVVGLGMKWDSISSNTDIGVVIRPASVPPGVTWHNLVQRFTVYRDQGMSWHTLNYPMGRPTYGAMSFTIEFYRIDDANGYNAVEIRTGRSWVSA